MFIALCGDKGSPGVTTTAVALASAWARQAIAVEANPGGGDLAIRIHPGGSALPETPTVLSVATAARAEREQDPVATHAHALNSTTAVVPGAVLAEQMANIGDLSPLTDALMRCASPVFVDVGHLHSSSPMLGVAARADLVIAVGRPDTSSVIRLRERLIRVAPDLAHLRGAAPRLLPLLVTTSRHGAPDVADLRGILAETPVKPFVVDCGFLAHDPSGVRRLEAGDEPGGRLSRTDLLRTARAVTSRIESLAGSSATAPKSSMVGGHR
ncbi:MAG: hypothetical protein GEU96_04035 [Propionibacteriales bacterium]|nr:hypothetical protein [Propionibacteriales bacterium]